MGVKHAANRFHRTPVEVLDGGVWASAGKGTLLVNDRALTGSDLNSKLRTLLTNPDQPLPASASVLRLDDEIYLIGSSVIDRYENPYSIATQIRKANFTCSLVALTFSTAASGAKIAPVRTVKDTTHCDKEPAGTSTSKEFPATEFIDEVIVLPRGVSLDTAYELHIQDSTSHLTYDLQEVWQYFGMTYCRGICSRSAIGLL